MNVFSGWWPKKPMYLQDASWCQLVKQPCKSCIIDRGWIDKWMDGCFPIFNSQLTWGDFLATWWAIHILSLDHFGQCQKTPSLIKCNIRIMKPLSFLAPDGKCFISLYYTVCYYIILVVLFHPSWLTPLWIIAKKLLFFLFISPHGNFSSGSNCLFRCPLCLRRVGLSSQLFQRGQSYRRNVCWSDR